MIITEDYVDLDTPTGTMRTFRFRPGFSGTFPAIILFSEIFQVTGPIARTARMLASHGYIVTVPEVYHEFEPLGTPFSYTPQDTDKGNRYKIEKELAAYDSDARAVIQYLLSLPECNGRIGSIGICLGGHLSFRCAMNPEIKAAVCFYATDIHKRSLGKGLNDDSLQRASNGDIKGELMMIWGRQDPHVVREGRELIHKTLLDAGTNVTWHEFNGQHAFIRDEGYRYNPSIAKICMDMALELFHRKLYAGEPAATPTGTAETRS